jgi:predicted metalloprotease with PDZ domain
MQATASVGDRFPRDQVHFIIASVNSQGKEAVFGMVRRGGGSSILLIPSPDASAAELETNWVAVHELSHLWLPPLHSKDRWISEGIATYLQEVLRARCGLQSSERAWMRLQEGFERGRKSGTGRQLASESRNMNRTGAYHRVYWAGTAFALEVDVRLREDSNGEMTLLRAISDAQRVWGNEARPVAASVVLNALQEASGAEFIEGLGEKYAKRTDFPDVGYVAAPEYREVRAQITSRADQACGINVESSR